MAAPTPTARVAPSGIRLGNGHPTKVTLALDTNIELWEQTVTPPGVDGGDKIDVSNMWNTEYRTYNPRTLKEMTDMEVSAQYDPIIWQSLLAAVNRRDTITVTFPEGTTLAFHGWVKSFEPEEIQEGEVPMITVTICAANQDTAGAEQAAVLTNIAGT
jgi:hypothetical protein